MKSDQISSAYNRYGRKKTRSVIRKTKKIQLDVYVMTDVGTNSIKSW